ncbi:hypothetical protein SCAR479_11127 [Seiridium cardinale]|uniref:Secreted protein n=1 Tax=Seiridium cardinale TaxID=138064 RepID=A0ABR2XET5_9PEZI
MPAFKKVLMLFAASLLLVQIASNSMIHLFALGGGYHSPCSERLYYNSFSLGQSMATTRKPRPRASEIDRGSSLSWPSWCLPICGNRDCTNVESMQRQYIGAYEK